MNSHLQQLRLSPSLVRRIAAIDEFKGRWQARGNLAPERLVRAGDLPAFMRFSE